MKNLLRLFPIFLFGYIGLSPTLRAECKLQAVAPFGPLEPLTEAKPALPRPGSENKGPLDGNVTVPLTITLRPHPGAPDMDKLLEQMAAQPPAQRHYLTREEMAKLEGASPEEMDRAVQYLKSKGLVVKSQDLGSRMIEVEGKASDINRAFDVVLENYVGPDGRTYHSTSTAPSVPSDVKPAITGLFGLDTRQVAFPRPGLPIRRAGAGGP